MNHRWFLPLWPRFTGIYTRKSSGRHESFPYSHGSVCYSLELTGDQLKYDNVIFQLCECYPLDDHGYLAIEAEKGGTAYVFTKGTYEKCTWTKDDIESPARYFDEDGNEITINQGKTWVCVVYDTKEDQIVIE